MDISEKTREFSGLLIAYCSKPQQFLPFPHKEELANQDWAASHFVYVLLKYADSPPRPTLEALRKFRDKFSEEQKINIDLPSLLARHWVRAWSGEVRIPQQIQHQFIYLRDYGKDKPRPDFWERHEHDFQFLECFQQQFPSEAAHSTIPKKQFLELAEKHRAVFPKTPNAEGLFKLGWFEETSDETVSVSFHTNPSNHDFANEIAVFVWRELVAENDKADNFALLKKWEDKVLRNGFYPSGFLKRLPNIERERFVAAVFQQIEKEEDLLHPESEIIKARLNYYMDNRYDFLPDKVLDFPLERMCGYDSFEEVRHWDLILGDLFHMQLARYNLNTYLREILIHERASQSKTWERDYLKNAERLLELGQTRPVLLYTIYELVERDFPEVIPVFFKSTENLSIGTFIVQYAPIRPELLPEKHRRSALPEKQFRSLLFQSAFEIALEKMALQHDAALAGKTVCESLLMLSKWIFNTKETDETEEGKDKNKGSLAGELYRRYQNAWATIEARRVDIWFLKDLNPFLEFANGYMERLENQAKFPTRNNLKYLDLSHAALLSSLCRVVQKFRKAHPDDESGKDLEKRIRNVFIKKYCEEFKVVKMDILDIRQNCFLSGDANWAFEPDRPDFLEFDPLFDASRSEIGKFLDAVRPQDFQLVEENEAMPDGTEGEEDSSWLLNKDGKDRSEKIKYRTHFRVLLRLCRAFADEKVKRKIGWSNWKSAEDQIRQKLLDWAAFNRDDNEAGLFNIYDALLGNFYSSSPPLIQDVTRTVNLFPEEADRLEFIRQLTEGMTSLDLLLKIHNSLFDASCRNYVKGVINGIDLDTFTGSQYLWRPIEAALIEATNEGVFLGIAENLLAFVKKRSNLKKTIFGYQHSKLLFEIQLILAYRKLDRNEVKNAADEYRADTDNQDEDYLQKRLQFFDGIFLMAENKMEEASNIWQKLSESDTSVDVHYRKFYCEARLAEGENNEQHRTGRLLNAYEDWEKYELGDGENEDLQRFWDGIIYCKMAYLDAIEADAEFDFHTSQLSQNGLFDLEVLSLIFKSYSRRGMDEYSVRLLKDVREYFNRYDTKSIERLDSIKRLINWDAATDYLKSALGSLNEASIDNLVKIVPSFFNKYQTIPEFLLYEFRFVAKELLDKIKSIESVKGENKFNDFFTVLLRSRLSFLRFEVGDQPREGAAEKDAGELDITVRYGSEKIAAYEAFIYRDKPRTEKHLTKVFKYNPTGQLFFSVIFFRGKNEDFETTFNEYQSILKNTPFPDRYRLQGDFEHVPEFPSLSNLLFGKTTHGKSKAVMFHLFVNLAYGEK